MFKEISCYQDDPNQIKRLFVDDYIHLSLWYLKNKPVALDNIIGFQISESKETINWSIDNNGKEIIGQSNIAKDCYLGAYKDQPTTWKLNESFISMLRKHCDDEQLLNFISTKLKIDNGNI
jgi:hypothetical protein